MSHPVIDIQNLSVAYKTYSKPIDSLKEILFGGIRHDTFWALRDVSLSISEGERVGIIGPNGAGKSTLLQTIAGSLQPTNGSIMVNGTISSLLSLVPAWNLEDSGIENIEFNLEMRGVDPNKIEMLKEDIVNFTDLGPFIYNPVRSYSSGMSARLSFAIATAIEPDILIIDEVLGTGDGYFAGRANRRMQEMCARGRALLFVSHSTSAVRMMCDRCIWIENGVIRQDGSTEQVLRHYEEDMLRQDEATNREVTSRRQVEQVRLASPEEVGITKEWILRIRPAHGQRFTDTHYIRDISCRVDGERHVIPLEMKGSGASGLSPYLDVQSCEWGRVFERSGHVNRMLLSRAGMRSGGHIRIPKPLNVDGDAALVELSFLETSILATEKLTVEMLSPDTGTWEPIEVEAATEAGWQRYSARTKLHQHTKLNAELLQKKAALALRKPVEIASIAVMLDGYSSISIPEMHPFEIVVDLLHNEPLPSVNVSLNIIRSDGVYVFYQPSGLNGENIQNYIGKSRVIFRFKNNPFGFGDYELNVFVTEGFDINKGAPQDIMDRSIGAIHFRIDLVRPISFGLINFLAATHTYLLDNTSARVRSLAEEPSICAQSVDDIAPLAFPPPYRRMVAINSDVEWTSWEAQLELMGLFAEYGLETAWSYWFFADPNATWRLFELNGSPSPQYEKAAHLIRSGLMDTNHSYGGVENGSGTRFTRAQIAPALEYFLNDGLSFPIYSNHGGLLDIQNIGGSWCTERKGELNASNYQSGDVIESHSYHLDLTSQAGARFYWLDIDCVSDPWLVADASDSQPSRLFTTQSARDGTPMLRFRRSNFGVRPLPLDFKLQIDHMLDKEDAGYQVIYNHFGFKRTSENKPGANPAPYLDIDGFAALKRLATAQSDGDVLVTTTERLLRHAFLHMTKPWLIERDGNVVTITFKRIVSWQGTILPISWRDLQGFTIPAADIETCVLKLGADIRTAEFWTVAGVRYAGLAWERLPATKILSEIM